MAYSDIVTALHTIFEGVQGIGPVLDYEPTSIPANKTLYSLLDSFERVKLGQVTAMRYRIRHRLLLSWTDPEQAEQDLTDLVDAIPEAVDDDQHLGGALTAGIAQIVSGDAGWVTAGSTLFRSLDFISEVLEK